MLIALMVVYNFMMFIICGQLISGHYIQHCPTNGDPNYDIKKFRPPAGMPKSMLVPMVDGSYALPSGTSAVLKLNEYVRLLS